MSRHQPHHTALLLVIAFVAAAVGLTACGGGGGGGGGGSTQPIFTGVTTAAIIDEDNAEEVGTKAIEAAAQAISNDAADGTLPTGISISSSASSKDNAGFVHDLSQRLIAGAQANTVIGATFTPSQAELNEIPGYCGGNYVVTFNGNETNNNGRVDYNNLCIEHDILGDPVQYTFNGRYNFATAGDNFTATYAVTMSGSDGSSSTTNFSMTCSNNFFTCELFSDYLGSDGKTYRISNYAVSGDANSGFGVAGTFYHPDHGYIEFTMNGIKFECQGIPPELQPSEGSFTFSAANGSGTVGFLDCEEFSWSFDNGVTVISDIGTWQ